MKLRILFEDMNNPEVLAYLKTCLTNVMSSNIEQARSGKIEHPESAANMLYLIERGGGFLVRLPAEFGKMINPIEATGFHDEDHFGSDHYLMMVDEKSAKWGRSGDRSWTPLPSYMSDELRKLATRGIQMLKTTAYNSKPDMSKINFKESQNPTDMAESLRFISILKPYIYDRLKVSRAFALSDINKTKQIAKKHNTDAETTARMVQNVINKTNVIIRIPKDLIQHLDKTKSHSGFHDDDEFIEDTYDKYEIIIGSDGINSDIQIPPIAEKYFLKLVRDFHNDIRARAGMQREA